MPSFDTQSIAVATGGDLIGSGDIQITGLDTLDDAGPGDLTFIGTAVYAQKWPRSHASAALINASIEPRPEPGEGRALIVVENVDLTIAQLLKQIEPPPAELDAGIHPSAVIDPSAKLGDNVAIAAHCVIGPRVTLGDQTRLYPGVTILDDSTVGKQCVIQSGVVIRERCHLGDRCVLHPNVVIGADGFGYRPLTMPDGQTTLMKIPQIGEVRIGNDVEIGAGTCIDRAKFDATVIGDECKIDNLCQIAHNCKLGKRVMIAGCTGLAGSVTVGDGAVLGGMVAIKDHLTLGENCRVAGNSGVMDHVPAGQTWVGTPAMPIKTRAIQELAMQKLPEFMKAMSFKPKRDKTKS